MKRANFIGAPEFFNLNHACQALTEAFGYNIYLVGSALERRDFRDVDVRCILDDEDFARLFPACGNAPQHCASWSLLSAAISEWLRARTGLPIDFQFQAQTKANAENDGPRSALGLFVHERTA